MKPLFNPRYIALVLVVVGLGVAAYQISIPLRVSAQKRHCQSNLKQIGLATMQYIRDYDETFMLAPKWKEGVQPYGRFGRPSNFAYSCPTSQRDYAFNAHLDGALITLVNHPQRMALFYEPSRSINADGGTSWNAEGVHDEGSNVCFHDGHVKWVTAKPTFWTSELADVAGAKRHRDEENKRMRAQLKAQRNRERQQAEAYKKKQWSNPQP